MRLQETMRTILALCLCLILLIYVSARSPALATGSVEFATFLGGSAGERCYDIAVDSAGNIYLTGVTSSSDFVRPSYGVGDIFVAKLDPSGVPIYIRQFGGSRSDEGRSIVVDVEGNAYVAGYTESTYDFAVMDEILNVSDSLDIVVLKLDRTGELIYSTIIGGNGIDKPGSIAIGENNSVYVSGITHSSTFPMVSPYLSDAGGAFPHGFVLKLDSSGTSLNYSTYIGNIAPSYLPPVVVDDEGCAIVTRYMNDSSHILRFNRTGNGVTQLNTLQNRIDSYVLRNSQLVSVGDSVIVTLSMTGVVSLSYDMVPYSTLVSVDSDAEGSIYATGYTTDADFPMLHELYTPHGGLISDIFILKLSSTGELQYSTAYRSPNRHGEETPTTIAVDDQGTVHVSGWTTDEEFPVMNPYDPTFNGTSDCFVLKMTDLTPELPTTTPTTSSNTTTTTSAITIPPPLDTQTLSLIAVIGTAVVVVVAVIALKKR